MITFTGFSKYCSSDADAHGFNSAGHFYMRYLMLFRLNDLIG